MRLAWGVSTALQSALTLRQPQQQRVEHRIAAFNLVDGNELVRFMRLIDRSGAADDARNTQSAAEQSGLAAKADLDAFPVAGQWKGFRRMMV